eukprot:TRINITY_DN6366_c0_g1_i1.p1 TRINITY_DN6366_c0_g1~~TRINITY_DN6366_c0_g1_i1.p1  ORF type:complete len:411 (-),score=136.09 TRINITY_DN6366_c0_g1_i1:81-1259(-)
MVWHWLFCLFVWATAAEVFFSENFDDATWEKRWVPSEWKGKEMGAWKHTAGAWHVDPAVNMGIQTTQDMRHHAISAKLAKTFSNRDKDLVVQFSVKHELKEYSFCGGGYIKLLPSNLDQKKFGGDSEYAIMFGPDLCGYDVSRIHLIFTYKGKNLLKKEEIKLDYEEKDEYTHLYTLIVHPDNTYEVQFDQKEKSKGSLLEGWDFPQETSDDPTDKKPDDWVDEEEMDDPDDKKPDDYDKIPEEIPDPDAEKPEEWEDDSDGEWEAPMIKNPDFKGAWKPKRIPNPAYKGPWKAKQLKNPDFDPNVYVQDDVAYVGFEVWTVNNGTIFDNIIVCDSLKEAQLAAKPVMKTIGQKEKDVKAEWQKTQDGGKMESSADEDEEEEEDEEEDRDEL